MRYDITHRTSYSYATDVSVSHHIARLAPRALPYQQVVAHQVDIEPNPSLTTQRVDYFGNETTFFTVAGAHRTLVVTARTQVDVLQFPSYDPAQTPGWETLGDYCRNDDSTIPAEAREFVFPSSLVPRTSPLAQYAAQSFSPGRPVLEAVMDLTSRINADFVFDPKATTAATPLEQVIKNRRGVCQDFAHFQIGCLRAVGLPARYVSGYLETIPPPGKPKLVGADASHAWVQVFIPPFGWVDFDPTNNLLPSDRHITVAYGRDFDDVSPIRGVIVGGGKHFLTVGVDVTPVPQVSDNKSAG